MIPYVDKKMDKKMIKVLRRNILRPVFIIRFYYKMVLNNVLRC